jgi:hypothetical protein
MKTRFQNLIYLERALNKLKIHYEKKEKLLTNENLTSYQFDLIIPQSNGYDIIFSWNQEQYLLVVDISYWNQPYPIELFIDKIAQQYAGEVILGESKKLGFQTIKYQENLDGSNTLVLERWNKNY